ncbi:MAG: SHOCT domain-containing protein [Nitrososphaerota archaeon]
MSLWMIIGSLFWIAVVGVVIWALVRWLSSRSQPTTMPPVAGGQSALEILRQRYARGEIDAATYEQMRERLEGSSMMSVPRDAGGPTAI